MDVNILNDVKDAFDLLKMGIDLARSAKDCLPDSSEKQAAEEAMSKAELSAKIAEAKLAQSLGFYLCPKEWPPVILVAVQVHKNCDRYKCPSCKTEFRNQSKRNNQFRLDEITNQAEEDNDENHSAI